MQRFQRKPNPRKAQLWTAKGHAGPGPMHNSTIFQWHTLIWSGKGPTPTWKEIQQVKSEALWEAKTLMEGPLVALSAEKLGTVFFPSHPIAMGQGGKKIGMHFVFLPFTSCTIWILLWTMLLWESIVFRIGGTKDASRLDPYSRGGVIKPLEDNKTQYNLPEIERFAYIQVRHWVLHPSIKAGAARLLTGFKKWLKDGSHDRQIISHLYKQLIGPSPPDKTQG